jgi:hypothetical protein
MKKIIILGLFLGLVLMPMTAEAKVLPQAGKAAPSQSMVRSSGSTIGVSVKMRADRRAINVNFSNLQNASSVSYQLIYSHDGQQEGAMGGLTLNGQSTDKAELLFATCSNNVCRYHSNIKDARLEVSYTSKNGKKYLKKYKIRV